METFDYSYKSDIVESKYRKVEYWCPINSRGGKGSTMFNSESNIALDCQGLDGEWFQLATCFGGKVS